MTAIESNLHAISEAVNKIKVMPKESNPEGVKAELENILCHVARIHELLAPLLGSK